MNIGVNFDAALLFPGLRMPTDAFENEIGEERNGRRIDDLQAFDPLWTPAPSAVRGKHDSVPYLCVSSKVLIFVVN